MRSTVTLVQGSPDGAALVNAAWRLPGITEKAPTEAFLDLLDQVGVLLTVSDVTDRFFAHSVTQSQELMTLAEAASGHLQMDALMKRKALGTHLYWAYGINTEKYLATLR